MNPQHGLPKSTLDRITAVLEHVSQVQGAILFGSRAKGTHKSGSDIDLALQGSALDWRMIGKIYDDLDDLLLPHRFSLIHLDVNTDPAVAAHIARVGVTLFQRELAHA